MTRPADVAAAVSERDARYRPAAPDSARQPVDSLAKQALATEAGATVLPLIGRNTPFERLSDDEMKVTEAINQDRQAGAAYFTLAESFVAYIARRTSPETMAAIFRAPDAEAAVRRETGRSTEEWKAEWLRALRS